MRWPSWIIRSRPSRHIVRGVPRGQVSFGGGGFTDLRDGEILAGYPFGGGDLHGPGAANGMTTPLLMVQVSPSDILYISALDDRVRPKRFYLAPGDTQLSRRGHLRARWVAQRQSRGDARLAARPRGVR